MAASKIHQHLAALGVEGGRGRVLGGEDRTAAMASRLDPDGPRQTGLGRPLYQQTSFPIKAGHTMENRKIFFSKRIVLSQNLQSTSTLSKPILTLMCGCCRALKEKVQCLAQGHARMELDLNHQPLCLVS